MSAACLTVEGYASRLEQIQGQLNSHDKKVLSFVRVHSNRCVGWGLLLLLVSIDPRVAAHSVLLVPDPHPGGELREFVPGISA